MPISVNRFRTITRIRAANAPRAAASVGVAMPRKIEPTTAMNTRSSGDACNRCPIFSFMVDRVPRGMEPLLTSMPTYIVKIIAPAMSRPGKNPATRTSPTEASAVIA